MGFMKTVLACATGLILVMGLVTLVLWLMKRSEEKKMKANVDSHISAFKDMAEKVRNHGKTPVVDEDLNQ